MVCYLMILIEPVFSKYHQTIATNRPINQRINRLSKGKMSETVIIIGSEIEGEIEIGFFDPFEIGTIIVGNMPSKSGDYSSRIGRLCEAIRLSSARIR